MSTASNLKPCACGEVHYVDAQHYDRIQTECGAKWFVLQPKRNGPLVLFPHPGMPKTRQEMAALEKLEKENQNYE